jgi:hypothetical protein
MPPADVVADAPLPLAAPFTGLLPFWPVREPCGRAWPPFAVPFLAAPPVSDPAEAGAGEPSVTGAGGVYG